MKNPVNPVSVSAQEPNACAAAESSVPTPHAIPSLLSDDVIVSEDYERILGLLETGTPVVFVTGNAGTGKTTLIRYLRRP